MLKETIFNLLNNVKNTIDELVKQKAITNDLLSNYDRMSRASIHSWLEYALMEAGRRSNLVAVPEVKLSYDKPFNPKDIGLPSTMRRRHQKKVDVAFYSKNLRFIGFSEVTTTDEAHGCVHSKDIPNSKWVTPMDSFLYTAEHSRQKPEFVLLLTLLPKRLNRIPWNVNAEINRELKESGNDFYKVFSEGWKNLANQLRKSVPNTHLILMVSGNRIEFYGS